MTAGNPNSSPNFLFPSPSNVTTASKTLSTLLVLRTPMDVGDRLTSNEPIAHFLPYSIKKIYSLGLNRKITVVFPPLRSLHFDFPHGITWILSRRLSNDAPVTLKKTNCMNLTSSKFLRTEKLEPKYV